jgi:hypothetical protein
VVGRHECVADASERRPNLRVQQQRSEEFTPPSGTDA